MAEISGMTNESANETSKLLDSSTSSNGPSRVSFGGLKANDSIRSSFGRGLDRYLSLKWTDSLRNRTAQHPGVYPAAFLLRDAILGSAADMTEAVFEGVDYFDQYSMDNHPVLNYISRLCRWILTFRSINYLEQTAVWVLVLLTAIEPPFWCRDYEPVEVTVLEGYGECYSLMSMRGPPAFGGGEDVDYYPSFLSPWLSVHQSLAVECACICVVILLMLTRFGVDGLSLHRHFFFHKDGKGENVADVGNINLGAKILRIVRYVAVITLVWGMISWKWLGTSRQFAPLLRIVIIVTSSKPMQRELATVIQLVPEISSILFILMVIIVFYGWIGCVLFYETAEGAQSFSNLVESMWTLWIMVTTANYPDVMMPAYNQNPIMCIYFVSFMMISFFFIMNVVLASVVNTYQNDDDARKITIKNMRKKNLQSAFKLLDEDEEGWVDRETIMGVFRVLNEDCPEVRFIPAEEAELLFAILDTGTSSRIAPLMSRSWPYHD